MSLITPQIERSAMDAIEFFKEKNRMTKGCKNYCDKCKLSMLNNGHDMDCISLMNSNPEEAVKIVERWSKENPKETFAEHFEKSFGYDPGDICFRGSDCDCDCECDHCEWRRDAPYHVPEKGRK